MAWEKKENKESNNNNNNNNNNTNSRQLLWTVALVPFGLSICFLENTSEFTLMRFLFLCSSQDAHRGPGKVIDVTVPVQCQVKDSRLFLTESSKVQ